jgi:hypothetical protein
MQLEALVLPRWPMSSRLSELLPVRVILIAKAARGLRRRLPPCPGRCPRDSCAWLRRAPPERYRTLAQLARPAQRAVLAKASSMLPRRSGSKCSRTSNPKCNTKASLGDAQRIPAQ